MSSAVVLQEDGHEALADGKPQARQFWNRIPENVRGQIVTLAREDGEWRVTRADWGRAIGD